MAAALACRVGDQHHVKAGDLLFDVDAEPFR